MSEHEGDDAATEEWDDPPPDPGLEGEVLAERYRIIKRLGQGGMATVYLAEHVDIGRACAVKVLSPAYAGDAEAVERFLREARATSKVRHPNVIEITDFGRAEGTVFFVMELLKGEDLLERIVRAKRLPWAEAKDITLQICAALQAAHALQIVHRDLKPENCFCIPREGGGVQVKVLDFGIAKVSSASLHGPALTQFGRVFGTPAYMSPEQAEGLPVDLRTDVYSLGVTLYHALTGQPTFVADSAMGFLKQHMFSVPRAPTAVAPDANIPPEVEAIVLKALQKDPALRFQTMAELAEAILAVGTGRGAVKVVAEQLQAPPSFAGKAMSFRTEAARPDERPRRGPWVGAGAAVIVAAGLGWWAWPREAPPSPEPVVAAAPVQPVERPKQVEPPQPEPPPTIALRVSVTPAARVSDASGTVLGNTGDPAGVILPRSDSPRELVFSAEGYEDARATVTPDRDQSMNVVLKRKKKKAGAKVEAKAGTEPSLRPLDPFAKGKKK